MRYLSLALAILFGVVFIAIKILSPHSPVLAFLSATIEMPVSALATLNYLLGVGTGLFLAMFALSFQSKRGTSNQAVESHARSST